MSEILKFNFSSPRCLVCVSVPGFHVVVPAVEAVEVGGEELVEVVVVLDAKKTWKTNVIVRMTA